MCLSSSKKSENKSKEKSDLLKHRESISMSKRKEQVDEEIENNRFPLSKKIETDSMEKEEDSNIVNDEVKFISDHIDEKKIPMLIL